MPRPSGYSSVRSSPPSYDDESTVMANTTWISQQMLPPYHTPSMESSTSSSHVVKPLLKRRRVTRACDECRRKKIKCDGKHPCTHCTVYSYDCTYDQPSNRRRNPGPQYIEGLERDKQQLATLVRLLRPDINPFDSSFDADKLISELQGSNRTGDSMEDSPEDLGAESSDADSMLESMVEAAGRLEIDETGAMDFHGHSSSIAFLSHLKSNFQRVLGEDITTSIKSTAFPKTTPPGTIRKPTATSPLPTREVATILVDNCLEDACALMRFVHRPSFDQMFDRIYNVPEAEWGQQERDFLPLLYEVMAVGCLFADDVGDMGVGHSIAEGLVISSQSVKLVTDCLSTKYFLAGREMIELTDCRTIPTLQAIILMTIFLQSSTKMSTCYSYVGIALCAAVRMGLHRSMNLNLNPIEREVRKRTFWVIRKMDTYVTALLGLPKGIADEDIDQEMPLDVDDEYITETEIKEQPQGTVSIMTVVNSHTKLLSIMAKVVKAIYPLKQGCASGNGGYAVSFASIREIENDLQKWNDALPGGLAPDEHLPPSYRKSRYLLDMAFCHVQMMMYRPFIHYICSAVPHGNNATMAARNCFRTAIRIVNLADTMRERGVLNGAYWFTVYTTFFATVSLLFLVLEKPDGNSSCWKAAKKGKAALNCLKQRSHAAEKCSVALKRIFDSIPAHIIELAEKEVEEIPELKPSTSQDTPPSASGNIGQQTFSPTKPYQPTPTEHGNDHMVATPDHKSGRKSSHETYSPSNFSSSVATPDQQLQFPNVPTASSTGVDSMMMYTAPVFYSSNMNLDPSQQFVKPEMQREMDTDGPEAYPPTSRGVVYDLEAQVRNGWAPYGMHGQPQVSTGGDVSSYNFVNIDINGANSNLMLLQGHQTYGAMPGGGSAMALEDIFGDEWADPMTQHQIYR
ncbi:fungal-specific transcription factor domain-containing protein [Tirmania nivea]|nr:fungal-specific transcription factor domain-containing protein [Tirmania nivea]